MNEQSNIEALNPLLQQAIVSRSAVFNMDCIEFMKQVPDKFFHLAIVDPPYGIGAGSVNFQSGTRKRPSKFHKQNDWDTSIPAPEYWEQLFRVSKNQIVFGGNAKEKFDIDRIHPTQKPIQLYEWIIKEFMSEGNLILDTHLGSGGSRIAAHKAGKIFVGTEIDKDYFEMQEKRWKNFTAQTTLW